MLYIHSLEHQSIYSLVKVKVSLSRGSYVVDFETLVISVNVAQVSGTERQHVASDYALRLTTGASEVM
jgi:hypothetical protein